MKARKSIAIIFGGKSSEHDVSVMSALNIVNNIDKNRYKITLIKIDKKGNFYKINKISDFLNNSNKKNLFEINTLPKVDLAFPILHGEYGEDGKIQGYINTLGIPYVGSSILSSAICLDKDMTKRILRDAGMPIGRFISFKKSEKVNFNLIKKELGLPFFIKPANGGSSIGINKVKNKNEFTKSINEAFKYDDKIIIEENIIGREIECGILGNEEPIASGLGEIITKNSFYDYKMKYFNDNGVKIIAQVMLNKKVDKQIKEIAIKVYKLLGCKDMARVDFFLTKNNVVLVNEINTIPGFTKSSMYPLLWEKSGLPLSKLIDKLIELSLERNRNDKR